MTDIDTLRVHFHELSDRVVVLEDHAKEEKAERQTLARRVDVLQEQMVIFLLFWMSWYHF